MFSSGKLAYYPGIFSAFKAQQLNGDEAEAKRLLETEKETKEISWATQSWTWTGPDRWALTADTPLRTMRMMYKNI